MKSTPPPYLVVLGMLGFTLVACSTNAPPMSSSAAASATPAAPVALPAMPAPPAVPDSPLRPAVVAQPAAPAQVAALVAVAEPSQASSGGDTSPESAGGVAIDFDSQVTPFFAKYCYSCHDKEGRASGIGFDNKADILQTVVPGDADNSDLYDVLVSRKMPKGRIKPTAEEIEMIRQWINEGAKISNNIPAEG